MFVFIFLSLLTIITANPIFVSHSVNKGIKKPNNNASIRDDYKYTPGIGYHKLHLELATLNDAKKKCIEEGGYLAIVDSSNEERVLKSLYAETKTDKGQVGKQNYFINKRVTALDSTSEHNVLGEWDDGAHNNAHGVQHCAPVHKRRERDSGTCKLPFFCEISEF